MNKRQTKQIVAQLEEMTGVAVSSLTLSTTAPGTTTVRIAFASPIDVLTEAGTIVDGVLRIDLG